MKGYVLTTDGEKEIELIEVDATDVNSIDFDQFEGEFNFGSIQKAATANKKEIFTIISFGGWPEFAMKTVKRCWKEKNGLFKITLCKKFDIPHRRSCQKIIFAELSYPADLSSSSVDSIRKCAKIATASAVAAFPSGLQGMGTAFEIAFKGCLVIELADKVSFTVKSDTECGDWKPY